MAGLDPATHLARVRARMNYSPELLEESFGAIAP
jgi:hypothetical protein